MLPESRALLAYAEQQKDTLPLYQLRGIANAMEPSKQYLDPEEYKRFEALSAFIRAKLAPHNVC